MTKEMFGNALATVPGFKPVKTVHHKLPVISVHLLFWAMFLIPGVSFFSYDIFNRSFVVIFFYINFFYLLPRLSRSERQKKILETERLNAELNFLKLQINPHFLFNTLNSIYTQTLYKSEQTEHSILKFLHIMRNVLCGFAIAVTGNEPSLTVGNAITQTCRESTGGAGLINARKRWGVIYPNQYLPDVVENDHLYIVNLKIELDHES